MTVAAVAADPRVAADPGQEARAVAIGAGAMLGAKAFQLGLKLVTSLALIRYFGPADYGDYVFALSFSALFGVVSDFGITRLAVRDMAREPLHAAEILGSSIGARLLLAVASWILAQGALAAIGAGTGTRLAVGVAGLFFVVDALLSVVAVFQYRLSMQYEALVSMVTQTVDAALIFLLILREASVIQLVATPVLSGVFGVGLAAILARRYFGAAATFSRQRMTRLLRDALPVGMTQLVAITYIRLDSVLLGLLASSHDVGLYGAAFKPIEYLIVAAIVVINPLVPLLARWHDTDHTRFVDIFRRAAQIQLALMLPVAVVCALLAEPIVLTLYDADFAPSAQALRLLGIAQVLIAFNVLQSYVLLAGNKQRVTLAYDVAGLVVNVALNLLLIPRLGFVGAAVAALLTAAFIATCGAVAMQRLQRTALAAGPLVRVFGACAGFAAILAGLTLGGLPWLVATVAAGVCYPALLLLSGAVRYREIRQLLAGRARQTERDALDRDALAREEVLHADTV